MPEACNKSVNREPDLAELPLCCLRPESERTHLHAPVERVAVIGAAHLMAVQRPDHDSPGRSADGLKTERLKCSASAAREPNPNSRNRIKTVSGPSSAVKRTAGMFNEFASASRSRTGL